MTRRERKPVLERLSKAASLAALAMSALCFTSLEAQAEPVSFDVPGQPLDAALRQLAEQAGAQVLFTPETAWGVRSRPVAGRLEPIDALRLAVRGRGLDVAAVGDNMFVVRRAPQRAEGPRPRSRFTERPASEDIIVTARRPGDAARRMDAAYAVTVVGRERLDDLAPDALADILTLTPGFWVESSGGEASNNVRARGVPLDGFASIAVLEDGLPIQHDAGLGFLNPDQIWRPSVGVERIEVLRGGPAAVAASQAPGGAVNIITRAPPAALEADLALRTADHGGIRIEAFAGAPLGGWRLSAEGFWREDSGVRDSGFDANRGGMARLAAAGDIGPAELTVSVRRIDDRVAFYLPAPLRLSDNGDPEAIPGYDAGRGALVGPDLIGFNPSPTQGPVAPDFTAQDGTRVRLTQATVTAAAPLEGDWRLYAGLRVRASQTERNGLFPRSPQTLNSRLEPALAAARVEFDAVDSVRAQVVSTGEPWGGEDLIVLEAIASSIAAPLDEALFSARVDGGVRTGGAHHRLGVGVYAARSEAGFQRAASLALLQARENAALLDLVALDAAGAPIAALTDGGVVRYGVQYDNANGQQTAFAAFGTWEASLGPRWTLDAGLRWDFARQSGMVESALPVDLRGPTPADDAVLVGTGVLRPFEADFDGWNGTAGARLALGDGASVFARASRAARLPSLSVFYGDPTGAAAIVATTQSLDVGLSWERPRFALYAVAFRTRFDGFPFDETVIDPATSAVRSRVAFASSETIGLEIEGETRPIEGLRLQATVTLQEPQFNRFALNAVQSGQATMMDLSGRQLVRVPRVMARGAATTALVGDAGQAGLVVEHYGERFADAANRVRLPAFTVVSAHLRVRLGEGATLSLHGANLTNSLGLTEGNPRSGQIESLDYNQRLFAARPIFGRTFSAELAFRY